MLTVLTQYKDSLKADPQPAIMQIEQNLKPYINISVMSSYVIPEIWNAASVEDQQRFQNVFLILLLLYGSAVKSFQNNGFIFQAHER